MGIRAGRLIDAGVDGGARADHEFLVAASFRASLVLDPGGSWRSFDPEAALVSA
jgi:hypothetical protein